MRRRRRLVVAVAALGLSALVPGQAAQADPMEVTGVCDQALRVHRAENNSLRITTVSSFCVTNQGFADVVIEGTIPAVVGWTCLGGVAQGGATVTVIHEAGSIVAQDVGVTLTDAAGAVGMAFQKVGDGQRVAMDGPLVELFTSPLQCVFDADGVLWRGALSLVAVQE